MKIGTHERKKGLGVIDGCHAKASTQRQHENYPAAGCVGGSRCVHKMFLIRRVGLFFISLPCEGSQPGGKTLIR